MILVFSATLAILMTAMLVESVRYKQFAAKRNMQTTKSVFTIIWLMVTIVTAILLTGITAILLTLILFLA